MPRENQPIRIRNRRYNPWPRYVEAAIGLVLIILFIVGCCIRISPAVTAIAWVAILVVVLTAFCYFLIAQKPVRVLELGDRLAVLPLGPWYPAEELAQVEFNPDPFEDYDDNESPVHYCEVRVRPAAGAELRLTVVLRDANALRRWAEDHEVPVVVNDEALQLPPTESRGGGD